MSTAPTSELPNRQLPTDNVFGGELHNILDRNGRGRQLLSVSLAGHTDIEVDHLVAIVLEPNVMALDLTGTNVNDRIMNALAHMRPRDLSRLRELRLVNTQLTNDGIQHFQQTLKDWRSMLFYYYKLLVYML